ncbi:MAG: ATP-binding cassette domain-containing protein [Chitinivibrionales bacterium]|nr:ATP-binding cassette domain-containing protein [Chitinivibrionales bacterium]
METKPTAVTARDIHKKFGTLKVLEGVTLTAVRGDVIAILGASGSGKSTLLRCLNLLEIPDKGELTIGEENVCFKTNRRGENVPANLKQVERIRTRVAMVFQQFNLWSHMTILENVIEAPVHVLKIPRKLAIERAELYLHKAGIYDKKKNYPIQLSGGQQQRVAITRALAMEPEVILFDEPTSSLDPELTGEVLQMIRSLALEGRTMILVTHEIRFAREVSSRVIFLHDKKIEEQGLSVEVFKAPQSLRLQQFLATLF